ncbi:hypothetical protein CXB51_031240 [Gossypium anomalum]|uniref:Retrotransposon gag domain-containing protein n=1 Tax=Gossypium anomalum TaxID=47600 RepID=A0A8J6CKW4_9ROSI|nr:hypothetical protein CXB51_031240 [Gossypium anomalum]
MEKLRNDISSFVQMDLETLYDAWGRYKDLLRVCPHHGLPLWLQVQTFYNGLNPSTRQLIDAAIGGTLNNKTHEKAYDFIEEMSLNNYQWQVMRTKPSKVASVFNLDTVQPMMQCNTSGRGMNNTKCLAYDPSTMNEQVNYMGNKSRPQNYPYSHTYNTGWINYPNFSWGGQGNQRPEPPPGFQPRTSQLAKLISERPQGSLPNSTETNPREQLHGITIQYEEGLVESKPEPRQETVVSQDKVDESQNKQKLAKSLKELLANKRKLDDSSHVELNAVCSAILQNKLPNKLKDPGSFTIPYLIGGLAVNNALANLGVSINVMPYKMFKKLGLGKPKQTRMSIQLADKTIRFPRGIVEDILVKIDKFIFPVDFVVLDMEKDGDVPLIIGRPFLTTARTIINVGTGELTLCTSDESVTLQEKLLRNINEPQSSSCTNNGTIHERRMLHIDKLDEWQTYGKKEQKQHHVKFNEMNKFKELIVRKRSFDSVIHRDHVNTRSLTHTAWTHGRVPGRARAKRGQRACDTDLWTTRPGHTGCPRSCKNWS